MSPRLTPEVRFWRFVEKTDGCWVWKGTRRGDGYGLFWAGKKHESAHRFSWKLHFGKIPPGKFVCHHCDNPVCIRPDHLFCGTHSDNMQDCHSKGRGRAPRGERQHSAKLVSAQVVMIRRRYGSGETSQGQLARMLGVSQQTIFKIVHRTSWMHVA